MKFAIYDLEIQRAIPPKNADDRLPDIDYCDGWHDIDNMGIACWSLCLLDSETWDISNPISGTDPEGLMEELCLIHGTATVGGFNSRNFDDLLMQAHGHRIVSDFDILEMVLESAGIKNIAYWEMEPKRSYILASIAKGNGYEKTLTGEQAPIEWQRGNKRLVLDYCENDVRIEAETLKRLLLGELIDPNTGDKLLYPWPGIAAIV